jgi:chromosome segregation ATPase
MKNKYRSSPFILTLICAALVVAAPTADVLAQAYQGHLRFLESFAVRLYDRGETDQAMKEFQRLQNIEPNNPVAADYLKKISTGVKPAARAKTSTERLNNIAQDVEALKQHIADYERDTNELETIIRDLITENDALYVMLEKRTRELMELRTQLFGTSYADNYRDLEKTLPIARVPQRLHRAEDYLPEATAGAQATAVNTPIFVNASSSPESEALLSEKRDLLVNKALTVTRTNDTLARVKGELTDMNERLKRASGESSSMLDDIDRYYRDIKEEIALKNFDSQRAFSDLIVDYASKLRELENLKSSVLLRENALTNIKPEISSQSSEVARLNQALADKDRQIALLNTQVAKLQAENAAQKVTLDRQSADISPTTGQLDALSVAVDKIESLLRINDQKIAELESRTSRADMLTSENAISGIDKNSSLEALKEAVSKKTALTLDLQQKNAELTARLMAREKELAETQKAIQTLKMEAMTIKGGTSDREAVLTRLTELDNAASRKATALTEQKENLNRFAGRIGSFESQIAELNKTIADKDKKLDEQENFILLLEERTQLLDNQRLWLQAENDRMISELKALEADASAMPPNEKLIVALRKEIAQSDAKLKAVIGENKRLIAMIEIYQERSRNGVKPVVSPVMDEAARQDQLNVALNDQEKSTLIKNLREELADQDQALAAAQARVAEIELKSSAGEVKKEALKTVIDKRDDEMLRLKSELDLAKKDLAKVNAEAAQLRDAQNRLFVAENQLKDSGREADDLRMEIAQVRELLRAASEASVKKDVALSRLENEKARLEKLLNEDPKQLAGYQNRMKAYTWKSTQDIHKLKNELANVKERLAERTAEISNLQKKIQGLSRQTTETIKKQKDGAATGEKKDSSFGDTTGCLLHCEDQQKTSGDTSGCLLECLPQK